MRNEGKLMKILMIQTGVGEEEQNKMGVGNRYRINMPMLGMLYLKELTPSDIQVEFIDETDNLIKEYERYEIVAISGMTMHANRMYMLADKYREIGCHVVIGGIHASFLPDEVLQHADTVMIGEGENTWLEFIQDFRKNTPRKVYQASYPTDLSKLPLIDRSVVSGASYSPPYGTLNSVIATRGCPNSCDFCCVHKMYKRYRVRPIEHVIDEVRDLDNNVIIFQDDNLIGDIKYSQKLIEELGGLGRKWGGQVSINIANEESTLDLLKKAGCVSLFIGFESINEESLKSIHKSGVNKSNQYTEYIKRIQDRGIKIIGSFIVGMDFDTEKTIDELYEFIVTNKIDLPIVNCLTPFPGTDLFLKLEKEKRIIDYNWERYNLTQVVIEPKNMSASKLQYEYDTLVHYLNKQVIKSGFY
jgi:radical SAM superfamily enzyme YgiQ (UPF0313 family)